jgi:hypothetical protein
MDILQSLYPFLSSSTLKALVAFTLSLHMMDMEDFQTAEKLAFESVFILGTFFLGGIGVWIWSSEFGVRSLEGMRSVGGWKKKLTG